MAKKIIYIANARIPTEKAHGLQIMKMCEAFAQAGYVVDLWVPKRWNFIKDDPYAFYQVEKSFSITKLAVIDLVGRIPKFGHWLESVTFALAVIHRLRQEEQTSSIYSRDQFSLFFIKLLTKRPVFFELHVFPRKILWFHRYLWQRCQHIFCLNKLAVEKLGKAGVLANNITVTPSAVDRSLITTNVTKSQARARLGLDPAEKIAVYVGHLYPEKGVDTILAAAKLLNYPCRFLIIGGTESLIKKYSLKVKNQALTNISILGWKKHQEIFDYLIAADMLLLPNSAHYKHSREDTSPMKLFEYMASKRPIIASKVPALQEILSENLAYLFEPDNSSSLVQAITEVINHPEGAAIRAERAFEEVRHHSWEERAAIIISHFA